MRLFNTLTMQKEEFAPHKQGEVKMYVCGPTVYNLMHIGNARQIVAFDMIRRYLEYRGFAVRFVQNFTDVDDKIINKANSEGTTSQEISERYIKEFWVDANGLNFKPATVHPKATESMDVIIEIISTLISRGYAYEKDGDVYFRARKFEGYGKLSKMPLDDLEAGSRVDLDDRKDDALDFALWKKAKEGEPSWPSPWGGGRPGWHIECTAMIKKWLGDEIDIHGGGQDLVFPHHENELAQGECYCDKGYAKYWMHNGFVNVDNRKMSKSLGNFFTVRDVAEKYGYEPIRFMMLQVHYRSPINYSFDVINQSIAALSRITSCRENIEFLLGTAPEGDDDSFAETIASRKRQFIEAMDEDFNSADGLAAIFELVRDINTRLASPAPKALLIAAAEALDELCGVLGIVALPKKEQADTEIEELIAKRQEARKNKDFALADAIRKELEEKGIALKDTPQGVQWSYTKG